MRENELEQRRIEAAKILTALREQEEKLKSITDAQKNNAAQMEDLYLQDTLDIQQVENHRDYGIKLVIDEKNQQRIIDNTNMILKRKQEEVLEAHKKVEVLKKLKEKQEQEYYKEFWKTQGKEIDDITTSRYCIR